jgi:hypothetical protein
MADIGGTRREEQMATLDEIGQQKQRISERLARLDAERTKLGDQLNELEIAERVLTRFGGKEASAPTERRRRGRPARTAPAAGKRRSARGRQQAPTVSMSEAILKALQPHDDGATAGEILSYLSREFGMTVRPNHLVWRCNDTAVAAGSKTAISAGTCRPRRRANSQGSRLNRLIVEPSTATRSRI